MLKNAEEIKLPMLTCTYLHAYCRNGWMDELRFYVIFNSISVVSGRWLADNEMLCAMEPINIINILSPIGSGGGGGVGEEMIRTGSKMKLIFY